MKRFIITTALLAAVMFNFGKPATLSTVSTDIAKGLWPTGPIAKGVWPTAPRTGAELPLPNVLQQDWAKGIFPGGPYA